MDLKDRFLMNTDAETEGVWFVVGGPKERLKVARAANQVYAEALRKATKGREMALELETLPEGESNDILATAAAEGLLKDWEGMTRDGKAIKYSVTNAKREMTDMPEFRRYVEKLSNRVDRFRAKQDADTEKNSERSSDLTSE